MKLSSRSTKLRLAAAGGLATLALAGGVLGAAAPAMAAPLAAETSVAQAAATQASVAAVPTSTSAETTSAPAYSYSPINVESAAPGGTAAVDTVVTDSATGQPAADTSFALALYEGIPQAGKSINPVFCTAAKTNAQGNLLATLPIPSGVAAGTPMTVVIVNSANLSNLTATVFTVN